LVALLLTIFREFDADIHGLKRTERRPGNLYRRQMVLYLSLPSHNMQLSFASPTSLPSIIFFCRCWKGMISKSVQYISFFAMENMKPEENLFKFLYKVLLKAFHNLAKTARAYCISFI
jgi:hypothetical protein